MDIKSLLKNVLDLQAERSVTFYALDKAIKDFAEDVSLTEFNSKCQDITSKFSDISQHIRTIEDQIDEGSEARKLIRQLQDLEKDHFHKRIENTSLELKFHQLKYELKRQQFITKEKDEEEIDYITRTEEVALHKNKHQIFPLQDSINDVIEEMRYLIYEEGGEDGSI